MFSFSKSSHSHKGRVVEKWTFESKSTLLSSAAVADIDGDGRNEIVFGSKDGKVFCLSTDSVLKWQYQVSAKVGAKEAFFYDAERIDAVPSTPTLHDVDKDGQLEVLFGTELGVVHCLDSKGNEKWRYKAKGAVRGKIAVADVGGEPRILFGTSANNFRALDGKGKELLAAKLDGPVEGEPAVITGERTQLVVGTEKGTLYSFDTKGQQLWTFTAKGGLRARPVAGGLAGGQCIVVGDMAGILYCLDQRGQEQWRFASEGAIYGAAVLADVNKDDALEVIFGSCDNRAYCLNHQGEKLWSYETDFWVVSSPLVLDIDGDGRLEVVVGSYDNNLYVLDGEGAYSLDYMPGLAGVAHQAGHYSEVLTQEPGEQIGKRIWQIKTEGMIVGCERLEQNNIIVNVKTGQVDEITVQQQ